MLFICGASGSGVIRRRYMLARDGAIQYVMFMSRNRNGVQSQFRY